MRSTYQKYEAITLRFSKAYRLAVLDGHGFALSTGREPHLLVCDAHGALCGSLLSTAGECPLLIAHDLEMNAQNVSRIWSGTGSFLEANVVLQVGIPWSIRKA
jgi:hypothetical protein